MREVKFDDDDNDIYAPTKPRSILGKRTMSSKSKSKSKKIFSSSEHQNSLPKNKTIYCQTENQITPSPDKIFQVTKSKLRKNQSLYEQEVQDEIRKRKRSEVNKRHRETKKNEMMNLREKASS